MLGGRELSGARDENRLRMKRIASDRSEPSNVACAVRICRDLGADRRRESAADSKSPEAISVSPIVAHVSCPRAKDPKPLCPIPASPPVTHVCSELSRLRLDNRAGTEAPADASTIRGGFPIPLWRWTVPGRGATRFASPRRALRKAGGRIARGYRRGIPLGVVGQSPSYQRTAKRAGTGRERARKLPLPAVDRRGEFGTRLLHPRRPPPSHRGQ